MNDAMEGFYSPSSRFKKQTDHTKAAARIQKAKLTLGLCCLNETRDNELMWAHYASNFRGICVGYHTERPLRGLSTT